jgi:uncharacterized membrane protein YgdD (TMEM256/DUF423 family)
LLAAKLAKPARPVYKSGMKNFLFLAGLSGALAVIAGAFGAHGLEGRLEPRLLAAFTTAAHYQLVHAVAMAVAALAARDRRAAPRARLAAMLFLTGTLLFSGSLYALALSGIRVFAFVTPVGGVAFIAGWVLLALAALKLEEPT